VEHVKSVHTNGGRDVMLGLGYMGLLRSNICMGFLVRVPLGNPRVDFHTLILARGYNFIPIPLLAGRILYPYPYPTG
jgi:hypothetical protein